MARLFQYNFTAAKSIPVAVKLACCKSAAIVTLFERYTGKTYSNIAVSFNKPAKANAAIALVNAVHGNLDAWARFVSEVDQFHVDAIRQNRGTGKSVDQYEHNTNPRPIPERAAQQSNAQQTNTAAVEIESVPDEIAQAMDTTEPDIDSLENNETVSPSIDANTGNPLIDAIRAEINGALSTLKISAGTNKEEVNALIKAALQSHARPNIITIERKEADSTTQTNMGLQHKLFATLVSYVQLSFPVWIPGPAGSGKTTAVNNVAKALDASLYMPPEGPIENKYGMIGYCDASGRFNETSLYKACKEASDNPDKRVIYFIDECDAGYPNALMVLNAVMENGYCTFANGERVHFGRNLQFIAGANTFGNGATHDYVGRNKLDAATLDRFIFLPWDYDAELENALAANAAWVGTVQAIRARVQQLGIKQVVSPRASIRGAAMLAAGIPRDQVLTATVYKGMTADQVRSIGVN